MPCRNTPSRPAPIRWAPNGRGAAVTEHPPQRLIAIEPRAGALRMTTTDTHLARRIGLYLRFHYQENQDLLRVRWTS